MPTKVRHPFELALSFPARETEVRRSYHYRVSLHYYQLMWGLFAPGATTPNLEHYALFHGAMSTLVYAYPLEEGGRSIEGWMKNIRSLAEHEAIDILDACEYELPESFALSDSSHKRNFTFALVRYCVGHRIIENIGAVNAQAVLAEVEELIRDMVFQGVLIQRFSGGVANDAAYQICFRLITNVSCPISLPKTPA